MKFRRAHLIFLLFIASPVQLFADDSLKNRIEASLSPFITITQTSEKILFLYCPETPCSPIEAPANIDKNVFFEFALLYLFKESGYTEFKESGYKMPSGISPKDEFEKEVLSIEFKYKKQFPNEKNILNYLQSRYKITIGTVQVEKG